MNKSAEMPVNLPTIIDTSSLVAQEIYNQPLGLDTHLASVVS